MVKCIYVLENRLTYAAFVFVGQSRWGIDCLLVGVAGRSVTEPNYRYPERRARGVANGAPASAANDARVRRQTDRRGSDTITIVRGDAAQARMKYETNFVRSAAERDF